MAFPDPLYVALPNNKKLKIVGAECFTDTPKLVHTGASRHDIYNAAKAGQPKRLLLAGAEEEGAQTAPTPVSVAGHILSTQVSNYPMCDGSGASAPGAPAHPAITALNGLKSVAAPTVSEDSLFALSDDVAHIAGRPDPVWMTEREYWDDAAAPGLAQVLIGTASSGDYDVTLSCNETLVIGQVLSAVANFFPDGAIITGLKQISQRADSVSQNLFHGNVVTLSRKAEDSGDVALTFTGSNRVGAHYITEEDAQGAEITLILD